MIITNLVRKNDIDNDGVDKECHKNDEALATATLNLDEQSLRNVFASIGIADKDGNFPAGTVNYLVHEKLKKYAKACGK